MLEIWYRGWNGQGVIKIKRTTFVHTRNIWSESWVACLRSFSKLSTKNDCQEGKKSAQYNQYKLHEHETEHAEGLVTSRSQFNAHSQYCQKHPAHEIYPKLGAVSIQVSMHPNRCADTLSSKTKWDLAQCAFTRKELIQLSTRLLLIKNAVKSWIRDCLTLWLTC